MANVQRVGRRSALALLGATAVASATASEPVLAHALHGAGAADGEPALARPLHAPDAGAAPGEAGVAGLAHYQFEPRRADEVVTAWETGLLAAARQWPGFVEGRLLLDRAAGQAIAFGVFASQAAADAFGASEAFRTADARLASLLLTPPIREEYEVYGG
ncbi:MAG TPA: hypothetical protein VII06_24870 [Chloroflexota bacterium]|jgi:heme-degrading monooxygenase HmoA